jgi:hypothetical protein
MSAGGASAAHPRALPAPARILLGGLALTTATVAAGHAGAAKAATVALLVVSLLIAGRHVIARWSTLLGAVLATILFIPVNRYGLPAVLPIALEPYRVVVFVLILAWAVSLLIDPRVTARATRLEGPLAAVVIGVLGSELANPGRIGGVTTYVVKALTFFLSFVLFVYVVASLVRTRPQLERLLSLLVVGGGVIGFSAVLERATHVNPFDHLHTLLPFLTHEPVAQELRNGSVRAVASAGHPIELAVTMSMLLPVALYAGATRGRLMWWIPASLLVLGSLATGSRTGVIGLATVGAMMLWLRPRQTRRLWPALLPLFVVVHVAMPGTIGGITGAFFGGGGLIAQQSAEVTSTGVDPRLSHNRLNVWGPALHEYAGYNPLFGEGFGTRVTGFGSKDINAAILDNQWLKTLLETGMVGVVGWLWIMLRAIRRMSRLARPRREASEGWLPAAVATPVAVFMTCMLTYDAFSFIQGTFLLYTMLALSSVIERLYAEGAERRLSVVVWNPRAPERVVRA